MKNPIQSEKMDIFPFGNTILKTTKLGLGLAAIGRPGYINIGHAEDLSGITDEQNMYANALEIMNNAYTYGIRYFDVARSYGKGEDFLSQWLGINQYPNDLTVGSKWGYTYTANWQIDAEVHEIKDHSIVNLLRQYPISKELLTDNLRIYHIHSATLESGVLDNTEVLDALWQIQSEGIIIGLSLSGVHQSEVLEKALKVRNTHGILFGSVQATWNILEQSATNTLKKAADAGLGIIIKEALANGRLTGKNHTPENSAYINTLQQMALKYQTSIDAISLAFVLNQPWVNITLSGAANIQQLQSNIQALEIQLSQKDLEIIAGLKQSNNQYWADRAKLDWN